MKNKKLVMIPGPTPTVEPIQNQMARETVSFKDPDFVKDFKEFVLKEENIRSFKVIKNPYNQLAQSKDNPPPMMVVFLPRLPKDKASGVISSILKKILARYDEQVSREIDLGSCPRSNRRVRDFIHVAGAGGYEKEVYKRTGSKNTVYTDDYAFFKDYDIDIGSLIKQVKK